MKQVTYGERSMLMGDDTADLLLEYAAALSRKHSADTVKLRVVGSDGDEIEATILLGEGAPLMAETAVGDIIELDNTAAAEYMHKRLVIANSPPFIVPADPEDFVPVQRPLHRPASGPSAVR